ATRMLVQGGVGGAPFDEEDHEDNRDDHNRQPVDESPPFADETSDKPKNLASALPRVLPRILHAAVLPFVYYRLRGETPNARTHDNGNRQSVAIANPPSCAMVA